DDGGSEPEAASLPSVIIPCSRPERDSACLLSWWSGYSSLDYLHLGCGRAARPADERKDAKTQRREGTLRIVRFSVELGVFASLRSSGCLSASPRFADGRNF